MTSSWRLLLAVVLCAVAATAAHAQNLRVGYVDMKRVLDNAPQVVAGRELLDHEFRPRNEAIEADERVAEQMELRLQQGDVEVETRNRLERDLRELRRTINRRREDLRDEQISRAVEDIARANGYDLILSSPVVYANPDLDITDLILDQLQIEYEADRLEQGLP